MLLERSAYSDDGQFLAGSFMDYLLPTATDVPRIEIEQMETVPLDADVNFRGVGDGGMIVTRPRSVMPSRRPSPRLGSRSTSSTCRGSASSS